jgi:hypothetical protein
MNKNKISLLSLLFVLLVMGLVACQHRPAPATVRLNLTGTTGLKVAGNIVVDGVPQEFQGVLPTNITVVARTFEYTIRMQEPVGKLRGDLAIAGGGSGSSSATDDFSGVKGRYRYGWGARSFEITSVPKGQ